MDDFYAIISRMNELIGAPRINPFHSDIGAEQPKETYRQAINTMAHHFIYDEGHLDVDTIAATIKREMHNPAIAAIEKKQHGLKALEYLLNGIEAHERADLLYGGAWQATLIRQTAQHPNTPKIPELLTREEVTKEFAAFKFREMLERAECEALKYYAHLLKLRSGTIVVLREQINDKRDATIVLKGEISLKSDDIKILMNDLHVRIAERNPDNDTRKKTLQNLDRELEEIIGQSSDNDWGKRFELEEIYLLRRIIHTADTGYLVSVSHGTPRQDLNPHRKSVDIQITAAGKRYDLQIKTLKRGVSRKTREKQHDILERARQNMHSSPTHLVVLEAEAVQETYEKSLRQSKNAPTSLTDKYTTLEPIAETLDIDERHGLLSLLGLTEKNLLREQTESKLKYAKRKKLEVELSEKRKRDIERKADIEKREYLAILAVKEREKKEAQKQKEAQISAQHERELLAKAKRHTTLERQKRRGIEREALTKIIAERKVEEAQKSAKLAKKEEYRKKREEGKHETLKWPPKNLKNLSTAAVLQNIGILSKDWNGDISTFLTAKKQFLTLFAKPKHNGATLTEMDKPTTFFMKVFPAQKNLLAPTSEDLKRMRTLVKQK